MSTKSSQIQNIARLSEFLNDIYPSYEISSSNLRSSSMKLQMHFTFPYGGAVDSPSSQVVNVPRPTADVSYQAYRER